jgi:hypothetical protein
VRGLWKKEIVLCGGRGVSSKKSEKKPEAKAAAKTPSPREKLKIKTKDNDWYESAFKRFSISLNRANQQKDPLATLTYTMKSGLH